MPKSKVGRGGCSGDAWESCLATIPGGRGNAGNGFISLSSVGLRCGLLLALEDWLVGALEPESESALDVLERAVLDPVLEIVCVLGREAKI